MGVCILYVSVLTGHWWWARSGRGQVKWWLVVERSESWSRAGVVGGGQAGDPLEPGQPDLESNQGQNNQRAGPADEPREPETEEQVAMET